VPLDVLSMHSRVSADLIVLSACDTGVLSVSGSDDIYGWPQALMMSGAARVMVSLWPVPMQSTVALMRTFYRQLVDSGRVSVSHALARAQRSVAVNADWAHPYHWAGFTVYGDGSRAFPW
jgi:CHAT domain-containing protein